MAKKSKDKSNALDKKGKKDKQKKIAEVKAAGSEESVSYTHGLVTASINAMLEAGIKEANKKKGDAAIDISAKAVELGIKWCAHNKVDFVTEETKQMKENVTELDAIRNKQRGRVISHTVN